MVAKGDTANKVGTYQLAIAAKHHGIPTLGVSWGYGKVEDMVAAGAAAIAHSPEQLLELLMK